jgi:hypothetical protein
LQKSNSTTKRTTTSFILTMKLLFAAVLSLWALAAALDQQGGRRLFLRQGENAPTETARTTANGTHTQWTEVGILEMANNGCPTGKKRQKDEDDMGLRFNKFEMLNGSDVTLDWKDYPLNDRLGSKLRYESNAISVILKDDFDVKDVCINKYIRAVGGYPAFPSNDTKSAFWPELFNVVRTQIARRNGVLPNPSVFTLPDLWKGWNVDQVGEAVHDEVRFFHLLRFCQRSMHDLTIVRAPSFPEFITRNYSNRFWIVKLSRWI